MPLRTNNLCIALVEGAGIRGMESRNYMLLLGVQI